MSVAEARRNAFWRQLTKFIGERIDGTREDLAGDDASLLHGGLDVSSDLRAAYDALREKEWARCTEIANRVKTLSWDVRGQRCRAPIDEKKNEENKESESGGVEHVYGGAGGQWPHPCWKEAYVFALLMLGCSLMCVSEPDYAKGIVYIAPVSLFLLRGRGDVCGESGGGGTCVYMRVYTSVFVV